MAWDGIYAEDREYKMFNVGDEIFTTKSSWSAISANKVYNVVSCKYQSNYLKKDGERLNPVILVELVTDGGYLGKYSSYQFQKTDRQIREDRINSVLKKANG
jgi:hypothetical protein